MIYFSQTTERNQAKYIGVQIYPYQGTDVSLEFSHHKSKVGVFFISISVSQIRRMLADLRVGKPFCYKTDEDETTSGFVVGWTSRGLLSFSASDDFDRAFIDDPLMPTGVRIVGGGGARGNVFRMTMGRHQGIKLLDDLEETLGKLPNAIQEELNRIAYEKSRMDEPAFWAANPKLEEIVKSIAQEGRFSEARTYFLDRFLEWNAANPVSRNIAKPVLMG